MKRILYSIVAVAATLSLTMCAKNDINPAGENTPAVMETVSVNIADNSKVAITQGDAKLCLSWQENDQLRIEAATSEIFSIQPGFSAHSAQFTGNTPGAGNRTVIFPASYASATAIKARSYTNQIQDGADTTAHLEFNALVENVTSTKELDLTSGNVNAKINQAVKFVVKLPKGVTTVDSLILQAPSALFYTTNGGSEMTDKLVLKFTNTDVSKSGQVLTAYMMASWQEMNIPSGTEFTVKVVVPGQSEVCCFSLKATTNQAYKWVGGKTFTFDMSSKELEHKIQGAGTEAEPYLLYDVYDLQQMKKLVVVDVRTYFKLMADVDMKDVTDWYSINQSDVMYKEGIDFDGNNHTISNFTNSSSTDLYPGFIGVLNGKIHDVTFVNANVSSSKKAVGVVCAYAGTGNFSGSMENVTVVNSTVTQTGAAPSGLVFGVNSTAGTYTNVSASGTVNVNTASVTGNTKIPTGGIAGQSVCSKYTNCSFKGTVNGGRLCGGIVGYEKTASSTFSQCSVEATINCKKITGAASECVGGIVGYMQGGTVENCYSTGSIIALDQTAGGIVGNIKTVSFVKNCFSTMTLEDNRNYGGIVGKASQDKWIVTYDKSLKIEKCIYWGSKIDCAKATDENGSSGSIIGFTTTKNVMKDCWRINDSKFTFVNTGNTANTPVDQPNNDPDTEEAWKIGDTPQVGTTSYSCPYWGKAAAADATASSVAKSLDWDETIWDLSGNEPKLK